MMALVSKHQGCLLALMEAQAPQWRQSRPPYDASQLLQHCTWCWAHQNVEVNHASSHSPAQRVVADHNFHGIAVEQQDAVAAAICTMQVTWSAEGKQAAQPESYANLDSYGNGRILTTASNQEENRPKFAWG